MAVGRVAVKAEGEAKEVEGVRAVVEEGGGGGKGGGGGQGAGFPSTTGNKSGKGRDNLPPKN